jgi:NADH dehydrogenase FAD-containing subunit
MAAAIAVLVRGAFLGGSARVVLIDRGKRILGTFSDELSQAAKDRLERLGVEVRLGQGVDNVDADGVIVDGERIFSRVVIWTAGIAPSPAGQWLNRGLCCRRYGITRSGRPRATGRSPGCHPAGPFRGPGDCAPNLGPAHFHAISLL